jgi:hypothetical protein
MKASLPDQQAEFDHGNEKGGPTLRWLATTEDDRLAQREREPGRGSAYGAVGVSWRAGL